jgi:hypothetical protein
VRHARAGYAHGHMGWSHLLICALLVLVGVLAVGVFGFGVTPWAIIAGAFCVVMMGSMIWMMVGMGKGAMHRH